MKLTTEFYQDEVRYGFYVPTAIKQAWGAELQILAEIDRICKKYNIRYFAEWGDADWCRAPWWICAVG